MTQNPIFAQDDTEAFGGSFLQVSLKNPLPAGVSVSKAIVAIGSIRKTVVNPTFPFVVNLTADETSKLQCKNQIFMKVFDANGKGKTCTGTLTFNVHPKVV